MSDVLHSSKLYIVGTPIGNLGDLSSRAIETLGSVAAIACEDTRRTGLLLDRSGIKNPGMIVVNAHSEREGSEKVLAILAQGKNVALVSDAGMPVISDPGAVLIQTVRSHGYQSEVVPGPCAISAALALISFIGDGRFCFEGFLPRKGTERRKRLELLAEEPRQIVIYEAPHRLHNTLADVASHLGESRECGIARELTKLHESHWTGPLSAAIEAEPKPRGEYVIVIGAQKTTPVEVDDVTIMAQLQERITVGDSKRDAIRHVAKTLDVSRNRVYELANKLS